MQSRKSAHQKKEYNLNYTKPVERKAMTNCKNCGHKIAQPDISGLDYWQHYKYKMNGTEFICLWNKDECYAKGCKCNKPEPKISNTASSPAKKQILKTFGKNLEKQGMGKWKFKKTRKKHD